MHARDLFLNYATVVVVENHRRLRLFCLMVPDGFIQHSDLIVGRSFTPSLVTHE